MGRQGAHVSVLEIDKDGWLCLAAHAEQKHLAFVRVSAIDAVVDTTGGCLVHIRGGFMFRQHAFPASAVIEVLREWQAKQAEPRPLDAGPFSKHPLT